MAVLPYLSCVKKCMGMHTCETLWVVIMLLAAAYILISNVGAAETYCQGARQTCESQLRDTLVALNRWQCDHLARNIC
eukprot:10309651-Heterocapsa_arctica.AAC.1